MKKNQILIAAGIVILLILGGIWCWQTKDIAMESSEVPRVENKEQQMVQKNDNTISVNSESKPMVHYFDPSISINSWRIYQNSDLGFSIKYPNDWTFEEVQNQYIKSLTNRYVTFHDPRHEGLYVNLGVKKEAETSVTPREFRTGVPGGDFFIKDTIKFGDGLAEERYLIDCYWEGGNCSTALVWFCAKDSCDDFSIGYGKVAFMEISMSDSDLKDTSVAEVMNIVHKMIETFHVSP